MLPSIKTDLYSCDELGIYTIFIPPYKNKSQGDLCHLFACFYLFLYPLIRSFIWSFLHLFFDMISRKNNITFFYVTYPALVNASAHPLRCSRLLSLAFSLQHKTA